MRELANQKASPEASLPTVFSVDYARFAQWPDALPDDIADVLRLFDGRRTLIEVLAASPFDRADTLRVFSKLVMEGRLTPAPVDTRAQSRTDDEHATREWLAADADEPAAPDSAARARVVAVAAAGLALALVSLGLLATHRSHPATAAVALAPAPTRAVSPSKSASPTKMVSPTEPVSPTKTVSATVNVSSTVNLPTPATVPAREPAATQPSARYRALVDQAQAAYARGQVRAALTAASSAAQLWPDGDEALVLVARCQLDRGETLAALDSARRAARANPQRADAFLIVGAAEQQRGRDDDARRAYERYLALAPTGAYAAELRSVLRTLR